MLTMRRINYITSLYHEEGLSIRQIAKKTGHHFDTVKKYLDKEDWNLEIEPQKERVSKLDPLKPIINKWLKEGCLKMTKSMLICQRTLGILIRHI